jgi:uncharacterized membrane protein YphA (DoxX/SURF4 family)/peroxiredoxin
VLVLLLLLLARLALALVLGVAAWAKLLDPVGTRRSMADFGVPAVLAPLFAWLVPALEVACAAALLFEGWAWWGAVGAATLMGIFMVAVAANMALGREPDCHCFGQLHSSRAGWPTLGRNGVLAAVAGLVVAQGPAGAGPGALAGVRLLTGNMSALGLGVVVWGAVMLIAGVWLYWVLPEDMPKHPWMTAVEAHLPKDDPPPVLAPPPSLRPVDAPPRPVAELEEGTVAPGFALESLHGLTVTLDDLRRAGQPVILIFTRPTCPACDTVLPDIGRWQRELVDRLVVMPVSKGGVEANRDKASAHQVVDVLLQQDDEVSAAYGVQILPSAALVVDGRIATRYAEGPDAIRTMVAQAAAGTAAS